MYDNYFKLLSQGEAFRSDNWTWQARMMDAMITGLESSLVGYTCVIFLYP